jgi:predicted NAD/FAD-binding protein
MASQLSLDEYIDARELGRELRDRFLVPLAAALWSLAPDRCGEFPAETFLRFLDQHGMLRPVRPLAWRTVVGGSQRYLDALLAKLATQRFALRLATPVDQVVRDPSGVTVIAAGHEHRFDQIIVATHANTALGLLAAPTDDERRVLGAFTYSRNRTVLHRDRSFLPRRAAAHAAWNYVADPDTAQVAVTYSMTRLQGLPDDPPYLVTLNPRTPPAAPLHEVTFDHPQFDRAALTAQAELSRLGRAQRTAYAGAHAGFGFHEDGLRSGIVAAASVLAGERGGT